MPTVNKKNADEKQTKTKNEEKKKKVKITDFVLRIVFAADLIKSRKFTDEEIVDKVNEKFVDYSGKLRVFNQHELGRARWAIRHGELTVSKLEEEKDFARLFRHPETGELVLRSALTKKKRAAKKVTKEEDPLNNIADIDVHGKKETEKKSKKKISKAEALKKKIKKNKKK